MPKTIMSPPIGQEMWPLSYDWLRFFPLLAYWLRNRIRLSLRQRRLNFYPSLCFSQYLLSLFLSITVSISFSVSVFFSPSFCFSLSICFFICLFLNCSVFFSVSLFLYLFLCFYTYFSVSVPISLFLYLFLYLFFLSVFL